MYGARVLQLQPGDSLNVAHLDGVVVSGGHDIEPVLYSAAAEVERRYDPERDAFESAIIDHALDEDIPLLGICRGAQLLNVRLGGSLFQDLRTRRRRTSNRRTILPLKWMDVVDDTRLHALAKADRIRVNSLHRQSIDTLGAGLKVCGRDLDDIVQAVEYPERRFVLGVQWHPEFMLYIARQRTLFEALVQAARVSDREIAPT